jgi:hypothetical protein
VGGEGGTTQEGVDGGLRKVGVNRTRDEDVVASMCSTVRSSEWFSEKHAIGRLRVNPVALLYFLFCSVLLRKMLD